MAKRGLIGDELSENFDQLLQPHIFKKEMYFTRMQALYDLAKSVESKPVALTEFRVRFRDIDSIKNTFEECVKLINSISKKHVPKYVPTYIEIQTFDSLYYYVMGIAESCLSPGGVDKLGLHPDTDSRGVRTRLPKLELFHFDSQLENWQTFYDTFQSLIHNNKNITNVEKFYYLITAVTGQALTIVKSMPVTDDNYNIVWGLLVKRFENKRALATSYLDKIFLFKTLTTESAVGLNSFLQTFSECYKALNLLKINDLSSFLLFYIALKNLDTTTRREFEQSIEQENHIPTFQELIQFVEKQVRVLEMSDFKVQTHKVQNSLKPTYSNLPSKSTFSKSTVNQNKYYPNKYFKQKQCLSAVSVAKPDTVVSSQQRQCTFCGLPHSIYRCFAYNDLTPLQRLNKVKELKLCENCLREGHYINECPSKTKCTLCKQMHHHTLHLDSNLAQHQEENPNSTFNRNQSRNVALTCSTNSTVLLGTAIIQVADSWGNYHPVRVVIDSGAMSSYMTNTCATRLGLTRTKCTFEPLGLGGVPVQDFGLVTCLIKPLDSSGPILNTECIIVLNITGDLLTVNLSSQLVNSFKNIKLADPTFFNCAPVDMLLGGEIFPYIYDGQKILPKTPGLPFALHSIFGYVIAGQTVLNNERLSNSVSCLFTQNKTSPSIEKIIHSFWETENVACVVPRNPEDEYVELLFTQQHSRDHTGRYTVAYPFQPNFKLGASHMQAMRRFLNLELKLNRSPHLKEQYTQFMSEYERLGHMTCLGNYGTVESKYIIPHFCVLRPGSSTTKLRVVFDASCKTTNNNSLNSVLYAGPKLQTDINEILINFRVHNICFSSDICKMYRMTWINKNQRQYQHVLWRSSSDQPIKVYELNTITYDVASSPFLAIRVLHQLADDEADKYPLAAKIIKKGFFVDDLLSSVATIEEAIKLQEELVTLLGKGGFVLRKWSSNNVQLLERVPADHRETPVTFKDDKDLSIKVLGLQWTPGNDSFSFAIAPVSTTTSKRGILSQIGRQFDPLGFAGPCVFYAKCFMQKLWMLNLGWDDSIPAHLEKEWLSYVSELPLLSSLKHQRQLTIKELCYAQMIGFCDASSLGYAATVYLRSINKLGDVKVSLVIAKSKVAPLKTVSIPRLELMAAHLLAKLFNYIKSIISEQILISDEFLFTDSSVVLGWLNTPAHSLKTFVATRVAKILETVSSECWFHVEGTSNPADICSRGALPSTLVSTSEWLNGPAWLYTQQAEWPVRSIRFFRHEAVPELKNVNVTLLSPQATNSPTDVYNLITKYSSYSKLQKVIARCFQFTNNCKVKKCQRNIGSPSLTDIKAAHDALIKVVQFEHFSDEIKTLSKGENVKSLSKLTPFIDERGYIRVGGRLSESSLPYAKKHPILLPKSCPFTKLLIDHYHVVYLHVGPRTLQSLLSQKYWIISAHSIIRTRISKCISCFKINPRSLQPMMGNLPKFRCEQSHAFHTVGVDIGGPFYTKESNRRNAKILKAYLCLFVCCATRAVHLEVLTALSTECFLAAFDRFTSRRGLCNTVVSDNGRNFTAAGKHLAEVSKFFVANNEFISTNLRLREVHWKYNPPAGSHFGGLYESAIKSAKQHLKRVVGNTALTFEELTTLFSRIEAVLNSRPLAILSSDPNEFQVLTPGHFLIGRELLSVPEYSSLDEPANRLTRWQLVQQSSQRFWNLWRKDYLHTLQQRTKWQTKCRNIQVGDLVLLHTESPPLQWPLGRVTKLFPGPDGVVRVVSVRTQNREFTRPVVKLSPLPIASESQ